MGSSEGEIKRADFWQKKLGEIHAALLVMKKTVGAETKQRKAIAYTLKGLAIFGSIAIATGFLKALAAQLVAIAIAVAVGIDQWISNYPRLLSVDQANKSLRALIAAIEHRHTMELDPILEMNGKQDPAAATKLAEMAKSIYDFAFRQKEAIQIALEEADTAALKRLTLEAEAVKGK